MENARILVVEDEKIVARDIKNRLKSLGYTVPAIVSSGEEAIKKAEEIRPDLVLMDIVLKGKIDGIKTAKEIYSRFNIPVVYLTAYSDQETIKRAKKTEPFGYIHKPFEIKEIRSTIEIALYKHSMESRLKEKKRWLALTLKSIEDGVVTTDKNGTVTFMNPIAEALTGWKKEEAIGRNLSEIFKIMGEETHTPLYEDPVTKAIKDGTVSGLSDCILLIAKDGTEIPIDKSTAPIRDDEGNITGVVLVLRKASKPRQLEEALRTHQFESMDKTN